MNFCFASEHAVLSSVRQDMKFSRFLLWRWLSTVMWRRVVW